jgi:glycosyltransferase involved in cell wall biosynthesis
VDAVANLRYPSHGESSASLIQAMSCGLPCLVTDHASFSELPDDTVLKIPFGEDEVEVLEARMRRLAEDPVARTTLGKRAREHVQTHHAPEAVARLLLGALRPTAAVRAELDGEPFDPRRYLLRRAEELARVPASVQRVA